MLNHIKSNPKLLRCGLVITLREIKPGYGRNEYALKDIYLSLNPAQLKRSIDAKLAKLYKAYEGKKGTQQVNPYKKVSASHGNILDDSTTCSRVTYLNNLTRTSNFRVIFKSSSLKEI